MSKMKDEELIHLVEERLEEIRNPTVGGIIRRFLQTKALAYQITNKIDLETVAEDQGFIVLDGKICHPPEEVSSINVYVDDTTRIMIRKGNVYIINKEEYERQRANR